MRKLKQKKVRLKDHGLETEYELGDWIVFQFEPMTKQRIYFSKLSDPDKWVDEQEAP